MQFNKNSLYPSDIFFAFYELKSKSMHFSNTISIHLFCIWTVSLKRVLNVLQF